MTSLQLLGAGLIAAPFIGLALLCFHLGGFWMFATGFGSAAVIIAMIAGGVALLNP